MTRNTGMAASIPACTIEDCPRLPNLLPASTYMLFVQYTDGTLTTGSVPTFTLEIM